MPELSVLAVYHETFRTIKEMVWNLLESQLFDVRDGVNPINLAVPDRVAGKIDLETTAREFYEAMAWDLETGAPSSERLEELGLGAWSISSPVRI